MLKKLTAAILLSAVILSIVSFSVSAAGFVPYLGYEYNQEDESVPAPVGYEPKKIVTGDDIGSGSLSKPTDFCFYENSLYILDSLNSRIIITDCDLKLERIIGKINGDGDILSYSGAKGIYVCENGNILIADTENQRIIETDNSGNFVKLMQKPQTPMIAESLVYSVTKTVRDHNGITYALVDGINEGAVTYFEDGTFGGFFAMNEVEQTSAVLLNYIWRRFMTEEQIRNSATPSPSSITNFDIAEKGFIYTVTQSSDEGASVRLLNFKGSNLKDKNEYGDVEWDRKIKDSVSTAFCDVDVDDDDYIYLLDSSRGRIFVYASSGDMITVFGGKGEKLGNFLSVSAVETNGDRVYVLDTLRNAITVFEANEYIKTLKTAQNLLENGQYTESKEYWEKVLTYNANSTTAYYGIGLALDESGQYKESLRYFKLAYSNKGYSNAFREVRKEFIKSNFAWLILIFSAVVAVVIFLIRFSKRKLGRKNAYEKSALEKKYLQPIFTMFHPYDGYASLKMSRGWSLGLSFGILSLLFLALTMQFFLTGFSFNTNRPLDYNVFIMLIKAFGIVAVCSVSNWAICTLMEGKGRFTDIFCMMVYSLVPLVICTFIGTLASNVLTAEESAFLAVIELTGLIWTGILILVGFISIHQFSFSKMLLSLLLTAVGIAIIIFLAILFFGLMQQVISFGKSIISEIIMII